MGTKALRLAIGAGVAAGALVAGGIPAQAAPAGGSARSRHVLLLSVDGMHQSDLSWWVRHHPHSALAGLVRRGNEYTDARTTFPSDSFPGTIAQVTGATPGTAGVYYDDTYDPALDAPGTTSCAGAPTDTEVSWTEAADRSQDPITLDAGQGIAAPPLTALPTNTKEQTLASSSAIRNAILRLTSAPTSLLDPAALPVDPATCKPVYPHDFIRVNTVFDVLHAKGYRTAWSDKHPAYEILNGPSGAGIDDLFTPEINAVADAAGDDWTTSNALTREYDGFKVAAVLNEIRGRDHSGTHRVGVPAVFGMNFQTVSTAQKLPSSEGLTGGYTASGEPGPLLRGAMASVDEQVGRMVSALRARHIARSTTIILSAKHGQSPIRPQQLRRIDDGAILDGLNAAWKATAHSSTDLVAFSVDDDVMLLWFHDRSREALAFAKGYLLAHSAPANRIGDAKGVTSATVQHSGLQRIVTGTAADAYVGARRGDPHVPDLIGIVQHGVVYTGNVKKISEHGGGAAEDRHVPLVVSGAGVGSSVVGRSVATTQIAPTLLRLLGVDPRDLQGVRRDHTAVLPRL